jgi:Mlc titration factor MtfA (ptsG expression regulator)
MSALSLQLKGCSVFFLFRNLRRRRLTNAAFPEPWEATLRAQARFAQLLVPEQQRRLRQSIQILVHEKYWEGCGGLVMSDEIKVTVAAHASRLTLGLEQEFFDHVKTVLVYPDAYTAPSRDVLGPGVVLEGQSERVGEAWHRGPVILAWQEVLGATRRGRRDGNVVLHEFAHQLDMRNGAEADGVPVIESKELAARWVRAMRHHYEWLCRACDHGHPTVLDCYGTMNLAEFFAVVTEAFFERPRALRQQMPQLYELFRDYYRQDTAPDTPELGLT